MNPKKELLWGLWVSPSYPSPKKTKNLDRRRAFREVKYGSFRQESAFREDKGSLPLRRAGVVLFDLLSCCVFVFHPHPGDGLLNEHVGSELCKDKNPWMDQRGMAQAATSSWSVWFLVGNGGMGYWDYYRGA